MRRFTVMGFTEAELGFVVAALFAAIAFATLRDRDAHAAGTEQARAAAHERDSVAAAFEQYRERTSAEIDGLRDSLNAFAKRSTKVPQCWEKGEPREPIAELVVLDVDRYELQGDTLDLGGIQVRFASHIARGDSLGCRYVLQARPTAGVDATAHTDAVWQLRRHFDVDDRAR